MRNIFIILLFFTTIFSGLTLKAQNQGRFPMIQERMAQAKLREIRFRLNLDETTFVQFRPIYIRYEREISTIDFRKLARLMKVYADSLTMEEADNMVMNQLFIARKLINIREKYYKEFRTVLSPQQIIVLYQTEAEMRNKVMKEMKRRMMNR